MQNFSVKSFQILWAGLPCYLCDGVTPYPGTHAQTHLVLERVKGKNNMYPRLRNKRGGGSKRGLDILTKNNKRGRAGIDGGIICDNNNEFIYILYILYYILQLHLVHKIAKKLIKFERKKIHFVGRNICGKSDFWSTFFVYMPIWARKSVNIHCSRNFSEIKSTWDICLSWTGPRN